MPVRDRSQEPGFRFPAFGSVPRAAFGHADGFENSASGMYVGYRSVSTRSDFVPGSSRFRFIVFLSPSHEVGRFGVVAVEKRLLSVSSRPMAILSLSFGSMAGMSMCRRIGGTESVPFFRSKIKGLSDKSDFNDLTPAGMDSGRGDFPFRGLVRQPL